VSLRKGFLSHDSLCLSHGTTISAPGMVRAAGSSNDRFALNDKSTTIPVLDRGVGTRRSVLVGHHSGRPTDDSQGVSGQAVHTKKVDYYRDGNLVPVEIGNASLKVQLDQLALSKLPGTVEQLTG
jgi:hypothetical protein